MRADQVGVVDIGVIDVLAGLHLRLQLLDHVAFPIRSWVSLMPVIAVKALRQHLRFIFMRGQRFGDDLDLHAGERLGRIDEPLHFLFLVGRDSVESSPIRCREILRLVHAGIGGPAMASKMPAVVASRCRRMISSQGLRLQSSRQAASTPGHLYLPLDVAEHADGVD
jgi:hypothetical protein